MQSKKKYDKSAQVSHSEMLKIAPIPCMFSKIICSCACCINHLYVCMLYKSSVRVHVV